MVECQYDEDVFPEPGWYCGDEDDENRPEATHEVGFMQSDGNDPELEQTWYESYALCARHAEFLRQAGLKRGMAEADLPQPIAAPHLICFWRDGTVTLEGKGTDLVSRIKDLRLSITKNEALRQLTEDQDRLEKALWVLGEMDEPSRDCRHARFVTPSGTIVCKEGGCVDAARYSLLVDDYTEALPGEDYREALEAPQGGGDAA